MEPCYGTRSTRLSSCGASNATARSIRINCLTSSTLAVSVRCYRTRKRCALSQTADQIPLRQNDLTYLTLMPWRCRVDTQSSPRRSPRQSPRVYTTGDRRRDEHLFNRATNWRLLQQRSPVVYTRGDRHGDCRGDNRRDDRFDLLPRRSPRVYAVLEYRPPAAIVYLPVFGMCYCQNKNYGPVWKVYFNQCSV